MEEKEIRLQKYLADAGVASRRAAEEFIAAGRVAVNGERAELGQKILPERDEVLFDGKKVEAGRAAPVYIMLNKPAGYVTTMSDERGRKCVASLVEDVGTRVYPCGRLDMDSEGLLLFTNDGGTANLLTHPGRGIPKIYHVRVRGELEAEQAKELGRPMVIDGYKTEPAVTEIITRKEGYTVLRVELYEGRNRQIRKMCEQLGLEVERLRRVAIGALTLGNLAPGKWRRLSAAQINWLRTALKKSVPRRSAGTGAAVKKYDKPEKGGT